MKRIAAAVLSFSLLATPFTHADSWPQYLGPDRNAVSSETGLLRSWPDEGPEVVWTVEMGSGFGSAAVVDGHVYVLDRVGTERDVLRCLDLNTGEEVWSAGYDSEGRTSYHGSRGTPTVTDEYIFTIGQQGDVACFDRASQSLKWRKHIREGFGEGTEMRWGFGQNPLIHNGKLYVAPMTEETTLIAMEPATGNVIWESEPLSGNASYVSPTLVTVDGEEHIVMISAIDKGRNRRAPVEEIPVEQHGMIAGFDPETGTKLWTYMGWQSIIPIPNVTQIEDGKIFMTGPYEAGSAMFTVSKTDSGYDVEELYTIDNYTAHCHPVVLYKDHLYGHGTTNETRDGMVCLDLDGTIMWKTGTDPVFDKGGFILVDDLIISADGRDGYLYLIDPSPEGFKPISKAKLLNEGEAWAPLALVDDKLIIRDQQQMRCILVK